MYSKEVTALIIADFAKGASAEETQDHLQEVLNIRPNINTIYSHRHSISAEQLVDEMIRQQQRDIGIAKQGHRNKDGQYIVKPDLGLALQYRDKLLDKLMQLKIEIVSKHLEINRSEVKHVIELVDPDNPAQTYPQVEVQAARRANIIPP